MNTCTSSHTKSLSLFCYSHRRKSYRMAFECTARVLTRECNEFRENCSFSLYLGTPLFCCVCVFCVSVCASASDRCAPEEIYCVHDLYTSAQVEINKNTPNNCFVHSFVECGERESSNSNNTISMRPRIEHGHSSMCVCAMCAFMCCGYNSQW